MPEQCGPCGDSGAEHDTRSVTVAATGLDVHAQYNSRLRDAGRLGFEAKEAEDSRLVAQLAVQELRLYESLNNRLQTNSAVESADFLQEELELLKDRLKNMQMENEGLRERIEQQSFATHEISSLQRRLSASEAVIDVQSQTVAGLQERLATQEASIANMWENRFAAVNERCLALEAAVKELTEENHNLGQSELCKQIAQKNEEICDLNDRNTSLGCEFERAQETIRTLEAKLDDLDVCGIPQMREQFKALEAELQNYKLIIGPTRSQVFGDHNLDQFQRYEAFIFEMQAQMTQQRQEAEAVTAELQRENERLLQCIENQRETVQKLKKQEAENRETIEKLEKRCSVKSAVQQSYRALQARLRQEEEANAALRLQVNQQESELQALRTRECAFLSKSEALLSSIRPQPPLLVQ